MHQEKVNFEEIEKFEKNFFNLIQKSCKILVVDSSMVKGQTSLRALKEYGYLNVEVETNYKRIPMLLKMHKDYRFLILAGDDKDNAVFKFYLSLKQKNDEIPDVIFMKEVVNDKTTEIFLKAGAKGLLKRPLEGENVAQLIESILAPVAEIKESNIELRPFYEYCLLRIRGDLLGNFINQILESLTEAQFEKQNLCLLDVSKVGRVDPSLKKVIQSSAEAFKGAGKKLFIFDPRNRFGKLNLENYELVEFI